MRCLGIAFVTGLIWVSLLDGHARADGPAWRQRQNAGQGSLRFASHTTEMSRHGWTAQSEHFVVVATTSKADAVWAAEELERTWAEINRLADQWTGVHRQPGFGQAGISLVITNQPRHPRSEPTDKPDLSPAGPDIYVNLSGSSESLQERLPQMRSEAFAAFLRVCRHEMLMPEWVQVGLASYFSDTPLPETPGGTLIAPDPFVLPSKGAWARQVMLDGGTMAIEGQRQAAQALLWVRYLLEGNDAQYADQFFTALATTLAQSSQDELSTTPKARGISPRPRIPQPQHPVAWEHLVGGQIASSDVSDWLADRDVGQPILEAVPGEPMLDERQREMVLILKLARRFPKATSTLVEPRVYEFPTESSATAATKAEEPVSIAALYQRLTDPAQPRWATIDTDRRLLLSSDKDRLAAIFLTPDCTYRTYRKDGHLVLAASFQSGEVWEGWLAENPANPKRPIAHLRRMPTEQPAADPPPTDQASTRPEATLRIIW